MSLKSRISDIESKHFTSYLIWSYLFFNSDKNNTIMFDYRLLCEKFNTSKSTVFRALQHLEEINRDKLYVEQYEEDERRWFKFYMNGKAEKQVKQELQLEKDVMAFLQEFYNKIDFEYSNLSKHKTYLKSFIKKHNASMVARNLPIDDKSVLESIKVFYDNLPKWWVDKGQIKLTTINRKYDEFVQQMKKQNGKSKQSEYARRIQETGNKDFSHLVSKGE